MVEAASMKRAGRSASKADKSALRPRLRRNEQDIYAGERLRVARRLAGCTQQQLADHLGVSFQAVQKYENGENRLSAGRLVKAAGFLGVDLPFFAKDMRSRQEDLGGSAGLSADEIDLVRAYRALHSDALRTQVRRLLSMMADSEAGDADGASPIR
jgi:transcriptional regulator with XRE-family HTH domain